MAPRHTPWERSAPHRRSNGEPQGAGENGSGRGDPRPLRFCASLEAYLHAPFACVLDRSDVPRWFNPFHFLNRPVRTRMPGGVAGIVGVYLTTREDTIPA
jgi:hypothetical protein